MIEINLLSEALKVKPKFKKIGIGIESRYLVYLMPLVFVILIFAHIYLVTLNIIKHQQFSMLNNKWQKLTPQRQMLENFKKEHELLSGDAKAIQQFSAQMTTWSEKLNKLSLNLPSGIWFNEFALTQKDFTLKGSVVSLQKEEIALINKFMDNLKNDSIFFKDFNNLELSSAQRKVIGGYEIVDFVLKGTLK